VKRRRHVALLIETSNAYARGVLEGVIDYNRHHERWSLFVPEQERGASPPTWLPGWKGDGIIARIETDEIANAVRSTNLPVVDVSAARHLPGIPWVETDDEAVVRMAVEHLVQRGFQNLAFCGDASFKWSMLREKQFRRIVQAAGLQVHVHASIPRCEPQYTWSDEKRNLAKWLRSLPRPVGIIGCYDIKAQQILDVCREVNIAVPEEAAVLGVDNDELQCNVAEPPLSSVICNTQRTGYEAAALLDRMMSGEDVGANAVLIKPLGVQTRQSTDVLAIEDPDVAAALRFIRESASTGINVNDVLRVVPLSRRVLEKRFVQCLGRTPHEEITRVKTDRVKQLLAETDLSLAEIAHRAGYRHVEYMSVAFKKVVGIQPSKYRQNERTHTPKP
jgi:LacI family transcriptional regulator